MNTQNMETIGERLKALRLKQELNQEQLAPYLHFGNKGMVSAFETGKRELSMRALMAYADYFSGVTKALMNIKGMNTNFRKNRMSNARIQQIVTLLYMHKEIVSSSGVHTKEAKGLHEVMDRAYKNKDYYKNNPMLKSTFDFLKMVVDSWFAHE